MTAARTNAAPSAPARIRSLAGVIERAAALVDDLYASGRFRAAEDLDALLAEAEELLEDVGDFEESGDLENDLLSEVDEDGGHERPTELPEDETHDDDLDFAYERGRYRPRSTERRGELRTPAGSRGRQSTVPASSSVGVGRCPQDS